jgi:hypothetical protein
VIARIIGRALSVLFAFLLAVLAGAATLFTLGMSWAAEEAVRYADAPQDEMTHMIHEGFGMLAFFVTVSPVLTLLPTIAVAVAGELARIRSVFYYITAGGAATAIMPLIASYRVESRESGESASAVIQSMGYQDPADRNRLEHRDIIWQQHNFELLSPIPVAELAMYRIQRLNHDTIFPRFRLEALRSPTT